MKELTLFGAGGHCYATIGLIESLGDHKVKCIWDHHPRTDQVLGIAVKKYEGEDLNSEKLIISIGDNASRKNVSKIISDGAPNLIHPTAVIGYRSQMGKGNQVFPGVILDTEVSIGNYCIINNNATVSHNSVIGDFVHIAINAAVSGGVQIGEGTLIGAGSVILPELKIGKWAVIGAGSVVLEDVPYGAVVVGNPARTIRINSHG